MAFVRMITIVYCICLFLGNIVEAAIIGMTWGRMANQRLIPSMVVDLILQNGISEIKLYSASDNVLKAFSGSGVGITITIPNDALKDIYSIERAREWVQDKVTKYVNMDVNIMYVSVGTEPFSPTFRNTTYDSAVDVQELIQDAMNEFGYGNRPKVIITHFTDILKPNYTKPSEAEFHDDIKDKMAKFLKILKENNSPFMIDMFPTHFIIQKNVDIEFAFVDGHSKYFIEDENRLNYTNAFDFLYDSVVWAMKKAGAGDLKLVVGQIGWPTDGFVDANITNAERFYKTLLPRVASHKGTPLRPGVPIDVYIHSIMDENKVKVVFGAFQRHWGIYSNDGKPKFKIDMLGQGRDIYPTEAKGITYMPKRWCIFNGDTSNLTKVKYAFEQACQVADCTTLAPGGSCSKLNFNQNVSYAFNRYFQTKSQKEDEDPCDFDGLAMIVPDNPSTGTCIFPVEVLSAEDIEMGTSMGERLSLPKVTKLAMLLSFILMILSLA